MNLNPGTLTVELQKSGARFTQTELILPDELSLDEWAEIGRKLCLASQAVKWWVGDWAAHGNRKFPGKVKEFAEANQRNFHALKTAAWVSASVEPTRRREQLDWLTHLEVAGLPAPKQSKWLEDAIKRRLEDSALRKEIRFDEADPVAKRPEGEVFQFMNITCNSLSQWLRNRPDDFWDSARKAAWRKLLLPIVKFYESLA